MGGRRIFIKDGQDLASAMKESGKFGSCTPDQRPSDFGDAYTEYTGKPEEAIDKLLAEKSGYVPAAISKEGVGDIDFVWGKTGNSGYGLAHIIERRSAQGVDGEAFVRNIPNLIQNGEVLRGSSTDRVLISDTKETAVVRLDYDGEKATWLVTAYIKD